MLIPPIPGWLCPKGQVTRAQEAEENYLVKRELATVKQQSEEAGAELEQAKKLIRQLQQQQQQQPDAVRRAPESPTGSLQGPEPGGSESGGRDWDVPAVPLFSPESVPLLHLNGVVRFLDSNSDASQLPTTTTTHTLTHSNSRLRFLSRLTLALGNLYFAMHDSILGHTHHRTVQSPFTARCIMGNAAICFSVMVVAFTWGVLFSIGLTLLIIDGWLLDDDVGAQQRFT